MKNTKELFVTKVTNAIMEEGRRIIQDKVKTINPIPNRATVERTVRQLICDKKLYRDMFDNGQARDIPYTPEECLFLATPSAFLFHDYLTGADDSVGEDNPANWDLVRVIDETICFAVDCARDVVLNTWDIESN